MSDSPPNAAHEDADELEGFLAASVDTTAVDTPSNVESKEGEDTKAAAAAEDDSDDEEEEDEDEGGDIELVLDSQTSATTHHGRTFSAITLKPTQTHKQRHNQHNTNQTQQQQQQQYNQPNSSSNGQSTGPSQQHSSNSAGPPADHPFRLPYPNESVYSTDMDALSDKPWKRPGADVSDWFNYGFDEETWKVYAQKQMQIRQINKQVKEGRGGGAATNNTQPPQQQPPAVQPPPQLPSHPMAHPHPSHPMAQPPQPLPQAGGGMARPFIPPPFVPSHLGGPPPSMPPPMPMPMGGGHGGPFAGPMPPYGPPGGQMGMPPPGYYGPPPGGVSGGRRGFSAMPPAGMEGGGGGGMGEGGEYGKRGREEWDDGRGEHVKRERMG